MSSRVIHQPVVSMVVLLFVLFWGLFVYFVFVYFLLLVLLEGGGVVGLGFVWVNI